ncbi:coproporphyrinogen III oxidase family protein [Myxococcota bacterium]|nr:coproporphyrinogen III oxidase family protein [Myxococcota bacterium]
MGFSLYVHVPFCVRICTYCDFPRVLLSSVTPAGATPAGATPAGGTPGAGEPEATFAAMISTLGALPAAMRTQPVDTVFFGGGTPSCVPPGLIAGILRTARDLFPFSDNAEISLEANPEDVTPAWIRAMREAGVNRFSLGVQSFACAGPLGRRHTPQRAIEAVGQLRAGGVTNLNLDLMFALPDQGPSELARDLDELIALSPEHVSCYGLTLEPDTPLGRDYAAGLHRFPDDEAWLKLYRTVQDRLEGAGYEQYEISNWARPGMECRHNLLIWEGADYLGIGPAAVSRWKRWRWTEPADPQEYRHLVDGCRWPQEGPSPWAAASDTVDDAGADIETLLTGTRLLRGFDLGRLHGRLLEDCICDLRTKGLLWQTGGRVGLTRPGLPVADSILAQLVDALRGPEESVR